ncbi:MAG: hypothetical protein EU535_01540 [Promethearchaeota archaeon]|nr:MAG: hypothetical protein EU535_01540 [Candidatus Lokiarchaeota archaeon]
MSKKTILKISSLIALIFSAIGAILLLFTPWAYWWYSYRVSGSYGTYHYYGSGVVNIATWPATIFILLVVLFLAICAAISLLTLISEANITRKHILISLVLAIISLIMIVIGAVVTVIDMRAHELYWAFGAGFYGSLFGTIFTILFTSIMLYAKEK